MLLEGVVTALFNRYLGPYVENLDGSQLKLNLFSGKVSLRNVLIKPDAIARLLDLPVRVISGVIGSINADIPLTFLRSKPIVLQLDEVYIVLAPDYEGKPHPHDLVAAAQSKLTQLLDIEKQFAAAAQTGRGGGSDASPSTPVGGAAGGAQIVEGFLSTALANLQFRITRVHIRYEHPLAILSTPSAPPSSSSSSFSRGVGSGGSSRSPSGPAPLSSSEGPLVRSLVAGITIAEMSISTANADWSVEYVRSIGLGFFKMGTVQGLSVYLDSAHIPYRKSVLAVMQHLSAGRAGGIGGSARGGVDAPSTAAAAAATGSGGVGGGAASHASARFVTGSGNSSASLGGGGGGGASTSSSSASPDAGSLSELLKAHARGLSSLSQIFEGQAAAGVITVAFPPSQLPPPLEGEEGGGQAEAGSSSIPVPSRTPSSSSSFPHSASKTGGGGGGSHNPQTPLPSGSAVAYILRPVHLTVRVAITQGYEVSKPKTSIAISIAPIVMTIADAQWALALTALASHSRAWECRSVGLPRPLDLLAIQAALASPSMPSSPSDADYCGGSGGSVRASRAREAGGASAKFRSKNRGGLKMPLSFRWRMALTAVRLIVRVALREKARVNFLNECALEYAALYLRRLAATESLGGGALYPNLTPSDRRRYVEIETDPRLTFLDIMSLRRGAERSARAQLRELGVEGENGTAAAAIDLTRRRATELKYFASVAEGGAGSKQSQQQQQHAGKWGAGGGGGGGGGGANGGPARQGPISTLLRPTATAASYVSSFFSSVSSSTTAALGGKHSAATAAAGATKGGKTSAAASASKHTAAATAGGSSEDDLAAALSSVSVDELQRLYEGAGYEFDATTSSGKPKVGSEHALAASEAARIANAGLPPSYVWFRLQVQISALELDLLEHVVGSSVMLRHKARKRTGGWSGIDATRGAILDAASAAVSPTALSGGGGDDALAGGGNSGAHTSSSSSSTTQSASPATVRPTSRWAAGGIAAATLAGQTSLLDGIGGGGGSGGVGGGEGRGAGSTSRSSASKVATNPGSILYSILGGGGAGGIKALRPIARFSISRSAVGYDQRAVSFSLGIDLGDVAVVDCGGVLSTAAALERGTSALQLAHPYVAFSDHSHHPRDGVGGGQ